MSGSETSARARDLRAMMADGVFFSAMVGMGETCLPAFALAAGLGEVVTGLVATVPMLAGAVFQLVTPMAVRRLGSYRRWVVWCARLQALSFAPLALGAALDRVSLAWVAAAAVAYWSFGMATGPAWNAWVTSLLPQGMRATFLARRARASQAALLVALLAAGLALEAGRRRGVALGVFALLFAAAMLSRLVSSAFLARQSEAPGLATGHRALGPRALASHVRSADSRHVLFYLVSLNAVTHVAAPYFTPYMLGPLGLSYGQFMALTATSFVARLAIFPLIGRVAQRRGARVVLLWGGLGVVPLPLLWLVSHDFRYLLCVQALSGAAWASLEFATMLSFFDGFDSRERAVRLQPGDGAGDRRRRAGGRAALPVVRRRPGGLRRPLRRLGGGARRHAGAAAPHARGAQRSARPAPAHARGATGARRRRAARPREHGPGPAHPGRGPGSGARSLAASALAPAAGTSRGGDPRARCCARSAGASAPSRRARRGCPAR
jgi:hypothetical protein